MKKRNLVPELMDNPDLDRKEHRRALSGLRRINWFSGTGRQIATAIEEVATERSLSSISVLDIGCGSGDVASTTALKLSRRFNCDIVGWDISQTAVETATQTWQTRLKQTDFSRHKSIPKVGFNQADVFSPPQQQFDFVYCCLFLHHFSEEQAIQVMVNMSRLARHAILIDDLIRNRFGLTLAYLACYGLTTSPVVRFDGPQSVRAAFTTDEVQQLARQANLHSVTLKKHWPQRYLAVGRSKE